MIKRGESLFLSISILSLKDCRLYLLSLEERKNPALIEKTTSGAAFVQNTASEVLFVSSPLVLPCRQATRFQPLVTMTLSYGV
jgi:hypothetical protein